MRIILSIRDEDMAYYDKEAKNRGQTRTGFIKQVLYEWREARERKEPAEGRGGDFKEGA
ncbi:MAG: hypothetical protein LBS24_07365 [Clostridiales Family XIII bacterium]|nr:hypothetical protein [Clostridiales Family XIII bacterium]